MGRTKTSQRTIEIASIGGIIALFVLMEVKFGLFELLAIELTQAIPSLRNYYISLSVGAWIGLCVYSLVQRTRALEEKEQREAVQANFERHKVIDPVTGLANRNGFSKVLTDELESKGNDTICVLGVEVSNLDTIISVHGSDIAERIEVALGDYMVALSKPDDRLSHANRSTFHVMFRGADADEIRYRVDHLIESINKVAGAGIHAKGLSLRAYVKFAVLDLSLHKEISSGWESSGILQRLDYALHSAKNRGRDTVVHFDEGMESAITQRAFIEAEFDEAISARQIVPYFQPFLDIRENKVIGFEILARWEHPMGQIQPGVFIPIVEENGDLPALTLSILKQACEAARNWPSNLKLAINFSPTDLRDEQLINDFLAILEEAGISPKQIEIEITETAFVQEAELTQNAVTKLKNAGISISIDDFGTGYSSLHHLRILQFDKIKIDQSFVMNMLVNAESKTIVQSIIALGKSFGIPTTAEGIETPQHKKLIQQLGCDLGQGYLFSRPLPEHDVADFLIKFEQDNADKSTVAA